MTPTRHGLPGTARRTKIVCTLGPASDTPEKIEALIKAGMNIVRLNMSHGTHERHRATIRAVREVADRLGVFVPVLLDLCGPKMRIGAFAAGSVTLRTGDDFTLTTRDVEGDWTIVSIKYAPLVEDVAVGKRILLGDGEIELEVKSKTDDEIRCGVVIGGELKSNKGVNAPGVQLRESVPTSRDLADVDFGLAEGVDWFALSFVRRVDEVEKLREFITSKGADVPVVVKIEKKEALDNIDGLLDAADGMMVARGDLGLELPFEQVPLIQKDLIRKAMQTVKPVITATQMLESMIDHPRPTRAEAADVANAVFDGTDAVMLSAETASGKYPVAAVRSMADVLLASETRIDYTRRFTRARPRESRSVPEAIAFAACTLAVETGAKVIISCTRSGQTALQVSNNRPDAKIAVVSPNPATLNQTMLYWHTHPIKIRMAADTDAMIEEAKRVVLDAGIAGAGDPVVIVAGVPIDVPGTTNMIKADVL
jgi:pyruvate kinase